MHILAYTHNLLAVRHSYESAHVSKEGFNHHLFILQSATKILASFFSYAGIRLHKYSPILAQLCCG